jgi:YVTN family beta-propeller protein
VRYRVAIPFIIALAATAGWGQYLETTIPVGEDPGCVLWNPASNKVYVCNRYDDEVTIIDGVTNAVRATVPVGEWPVDLAWCSAGNKVYVACADGDCVDVIDGVGDTLITSVHASAWPYGMSYNALQNKLYIACYDNNRIRVLDCATDELVASIPTVGGPNPTVWNPVSNRVFCSIYLHSRDTLLVIDCRNDEVVNAFPIGRVTRSQLWNPVDGLVYFMCADSVFAISAWGDSVEYAILVDGFSFQSACLLPALGRLFVGDWNSPGLVSVIDCYTHTVIDTFRPPTGRTFRLLCDTLRRKLYCYAGLLYTYDAVTLELLGGLEYQTSSLAWNPLQSRVYGTNGQYNVVYVFRDTTTGIEEVAGREAARPALTASPSAFTLSVEFRGVGAGRVEVFDREGRIVRVLDRPGGAGASCRWDGRDERGRAAPAGVYVAVLRGDAERRVKVVKVR